MYVADIKRKKKEMQNRPKEKDAHLSLCSAVQMEHGGGEVPTV